MLKLGLLSLTLSSHQEASGWVIRHIRIKNTKVCSSYQLVN